MPGDVDRQRWFAAFRRALTDPLPRPSITGRAASVDEWLAVFWRRAAPERAAVESAELAQPPSDERTPDERTPDERTPDDGVSGSEEARDASVDPPPPDPPLRHRTVGEGES